MKFVGCCKVSDKSMWLAALTTLTAFILSLFATGHCDFMRLELKEDITMTNPPFLLPELAGENIRLGLYSREELELGDEWSCTRWTESATDYFWDAKYKTAVAFGFLANLFGLFCFCFLMNVMCFAFDRHFLRFFALMLFFTGLFQSFAFIAFATDKCDDPMFDCEFSSMAGVNVAATVLWFFAGCFVGLGKADEESEEGQFEKGEEEEEQEPTKALPEQPADAADAAEAETPTEEKMEKDAASEEDPMEMAA